MPERFEGNIQMYPFLGVSYIASSLIKAGFNVELIDSTAERVSIHGILEIIKEKNPLFVGIYVNSFLLHSTYYIIKMIRENFNVPIVVGGPHITSIKGFEETLGADYGIYGYAESDIVELANLINEQSANNSYKLKDEANDVFDINSIPFPFRPKKFKKIYYSPFYRGPITTMIASRGCPFKCRFCASSILGRYQRRDVENVIEEIECVIKDGYKVIQFQDDTFNIDKKWLHKLCEKIITKGINRKIIWDCNIRPDLIAAEDIHLMKQAGCRMIRFGVESFSDYLRNDISKKGFTIAQIEDVINLAIRYGVKTLGYFMIGLPFETEQDIQKTINYIKSSKFNYVDISIATILPGTDFERMAIGQNLISSIVWNEVAINGREMPVFTSSSSLNQLRNFQKNALYGFYLNHNFIFREIISSSLERRFLNSLRTASTLFRHYLFNDF
ncbi:MAG: B12-binding domain-containing radical SAM protein [Myxococcota bacterium]